MEVTCTLTVHLLLPSSTSSAYIIMAMMPMVAMMSMVAIMTMHCNDDNDSNDHGYLALDDHPHLLHLQA